MMAASHQTPQTTIGDLFGADAPEPVRDVAIHDLTADSRQVTAGALFLAVAGGSRHGLEFLREAVEAGASAVAWEPSPEIPGPVVAPPAACFPIEGLRSRLGDIADRFFGCPSHRAEVVGVTGTNGKTTCAHLIASGLGSAGRKTGYIGTIGSGLPDRLQASELTTPDVIETHRRLAEIVDLGADAAAIEVSSHALAQGRVDGVRFKVAAFTNLSRDHLDYHGDMAAYGKAKRSLFAARGLGWAIANTDDPFGARMLEAVEPGAGTIAVGRAEHAAADRRLVLRDLEVLPDGLLLRLGGDWGDLELRSRLIGGFNADNLVLSLAVLLVMGLSPVRAVEALSAIEAPPGRMEVFRGGQSDGVLVVVDYAHTPDALGKVLEAARAHCRGRLLAVFGCGGDRDPGKRPEMGRIAECAADAVILTDDNPRSEDGGRIVADILAGMRTQPRIIRDRQAAIATAIDEAGPGDVVLVAGKGHEEYQIVDGERRCFSDREVVTRLTGDAR